MTHATYVRRLLPIRNVSALAALVVATLSAGTANAVFIDFALSDVELQVVSESESAGIVDRKTGFEPPASTKRFETLAQLSGLPFGKSQSLGSPFASATATPSHVVGVGASGFFFSSNAELRAEVFSRQSITNVDTLAGTSDFTYAVSPIDVGVLPGDGIHGMNAGILVLATMEHFHNGISSGIETLVDYSLGVSKPRNSGGDEAFDIDRSPDLVADAGLGTTISNGALFGVHYDEFGGKRSLGTLQPGDTVTVEYRFRAFVITRGTPELAAEAFVGDPFDLSGNAGGFNIVPGSSVPEPGTFSLVGLGLALAAVASRRLRKCATR